MSHSDLSLEECLDMSELPSYEFLFSLTSKVCDVLANESQSYRPSDCVGEPGSLLDFSDEDVPVIIVPDIHARPDFIKNILNCSLKLKKGEAACTILEGLKQKKLKVICVGDGVHTELYASRWELISIEFDKNDHKGFYMKAEMLLNLATLCSLMKLKLDFPESFHFLKGNHENILNCNFGGDYSFCKYADEGEMVKTFMLEWYDEQLVNAIAKYENCLPLVAFGKNYVVSHAEPAHAFTKAQLIDARYEEGVVEGLIWTRNGQVTKPTASEIITELIGKKGAKKALYFAGHRPIKGTYDLRQDGVFVQSHNPRNQNVFFVRSGKQFNFEKDIINTKVRLPDEQEEE